jgi:hypothetical protein
MIRRLQLGVSRLDLLNDGSLAVFRDQGWMHFGDAAEPSDTRGAPGTRLIAKARKHSLN